MSTKLKTFIGKKERIIKGEHKIKYEKVKIELISFYGGIKRGKSLQLTLKNDYVQLDNKQVQKLKNVLNKYF